MKQMTNFYGITIVMLGHQMQPELEPGQVGRVCRPEMVKPKMYVLKTESKRG